MNPEIELLMLGVAIIFSARGFFQGVLSDTLKLPLYKKAGGIVFEQKDYIIRRESAPWRYWLILGVYSVILVWSTANFIGNLLAV